MAHLFDKMLNKSRSKSGSDQVNKLVANLEKLSDGSSEKLQEDIAKTLNYIKVCFTQILPTDLLGIVDFYMGNNLSQRIRLLLRILVGIYLSSLSAS